VSLVHARVPGVDVVAIGLALALAPACGHRDTEPRSSVVDYTPVRVPVPADPVPEPPAPACGGDPIVLAPGLVAERHPIHAVPATGGSACLDAVRVDLARFRARLLTAAREGASHTAPAWREAFHLAAVINAGMFHANGKPVGLLVEDGVVLGADNSTMSGYLAFDPKRATDPPVVITGRDCPHADLASLRRRYRSIVQSSRLLGCDGHALPWADPKHYSAAAIGVDRAGRLVLLHARAAVTMTELSAALAAPELDLAGALFLEGGPEASLVAKGDTTEVSRVGSYETGFIENDGNTAFWWLPNVIAVEPR
jgi:uncharacterized protein YigE (DUF2233 family)